MHATMDRPGSSSQRPGARQHRRDSGTAGVVVDDTDKAACRQRRPIPLHGDTTDTFVLHDYDEIPHFLRDNKWIHTGYRVRFSWSLCFKSLFRMHNEWGNVWSHIVGLVIFVVLGAHTYVNVLEPNVWHYIVFTFLIAASLACMGFSALYHLVHCHSDETFSKYQMLDYFGISCCIVGTAVPAIYISYDCYPFWRNIYLVAYCSLGSTGIIGPMFAFYRSKEFRTPRIVLFACCAASGLIPLTHAVLLFPLNAHSAPTFIGVAVMFVFFASGLVFFISKVPERWYPGRFDYFFHSHQIWHIFVLFGAVIHFYTCLGAYERWKSTKGVC